MTTEPWRSFTERLLRSYGAVFSSAGSWCRATGADEAKANALAEELRVRHYQVRAVSKTKEGTWEVIFR